MALAMHDRFDMTNAGMFTIDSSRAINVPQEPPPSRWPERPETLPEDPPLDPKKPPKHDPEPWPEIEPPGTVPPAPAIEP